MSDKYEHLPRPWKAVTRDAVVWDVMSAGGTHVACGLNEPTARMIAGAPEALDAIRDIAEASAVEARVNVYVRWFSVDGKPDDSPSCFAPAELFKCPPARETR